MNVFARWTMQPRPAWAAVFALVLAVLAPGIAAAHHAFSVFDRSREVRRQGTVREFTGTNPHVSILLTVSEPRGPSDYAIEAQSPGALERVGWTPTSLTPGDRIAVTFHPLRDGGRGGAFVKLRLGNGKTLGGYY